jgi:hypothetical protein
MALLKSLLVILVVIAPLVFAAGSNILFGNLAATLVPRSPTPLLTLAPLNINDPNQQWNIVGDAISSAAPGYTNFVWDVSGASKASNAKVILYNKATNNPNNQRWSTTNGVITSFLAAGFTAKANGTTNIVMTYATPPAQATIQPAVTTPWYCQSVGDPHIAPYPGGRNDIYNPGAQIPGTITLSKTGVSTDPDYILIQADQQLCRPTVPGIYCNQRGILKTKGHVVEVKGDTVTIDGTVTPITGTHTVGDGVTVTKVATGNYVVSYPGGSTRFLQRSTGYFYYTDIAITINTGRQPTGGLCTQFMGPNVPPTNKRAVPAATFCLSWRARDMSEDLFYYSSELAWRAANPLNYTSVDSVTTTNQTLLNAAHTLCGPLNSSSSLVAQCGGLVDAAAMYQACLFDVIATGDYSFAEAHVDALASRCSKFAGNSSTLVLPTSGSNSVASGAGIQSPVAQSSSSVSFFITAKDVNGKTVTTGGDNFVVTISGGISSTQTYLGAGVYNVSYVPSTVGTITISVQYQGLTPIANSPFTVDVEGAATTDPSKTTVSGPGIVGKIPSGTAVSFVVQARTSSGAARTQGGDTVSVTITGYAELKPVQDNSDGTYTVTYEQFLSDTTFEINVKMNNVVIPGSPFSIYVIGEKK